MDDKCSLDPWGRHRWYQTTLSNHIRDRKSDGSVMTQEEEAQALGHWPASHACACGRWRLTSYPYPKKMITNKHHD